MIRPDQIPAAVVEAAYAAYRGNHTSPGADPMAATIVAALHAWPGGAVCHYTIADIEGWEMVLPLPTEADKGDYDYAGGL